MLTPTRQRFVTLQILVFYLVFFISKGIEKCAELQAQGMGCQPSVNPVPSDGEDGEGAQVEIWETCEEIPLTRRSCTGEVCSPKSFGLVHV